MNQMLAAMLFAALGAVAPEAADPLAESTCEPEIAALAASCDLIDQGVLTKTVRYALYRLSDGESDGGVYDAPPYDCTGIALFEGEAADPFWFGDGYMGESWFKAPIVVDRQDGGQMIIVRRTYTGTASLIVDYVFVEDDESFRAIAPTYDPEADGGVIRDLAGRLPDGLAIWKGVAIDYETMSGRSSLWRPDDANCCPTGGIVDFKLQLNEDRTALVVEDFVIIANAETTE